MDDVRDRRGATADRSRQWWWFAVWSFVGADLAFGVLAILSIGLPLLAAGVAVTAWLAARHADSRRGMWGLLAGAAVAAGFLAWTNRDGPGDVCRTTATEISCTQEWNPLPFAVAAVLLLGAALALFLFAGRTSPAGRSTR